MFRTITANIVVHSHNDVLSISTHCFITVMLERGLNIRYVVISKPLNTLAADLHSFLTFHGTTLEIRLKVGVPELCSQLSAVSLSVWNSQS